MPHAGRCAAVVTAAALANFHKHQRAVEVAQDEVDFSTAAPRRPIIARNELQPFGLQITQGLVLGRIADLFGGSGARVAMEVSP